MSIKTSTDERPDCILGTIQIKMHLLANGSHKEQFYFAEPVLFYVANNDIDLNFPIFGNPFLSQNTMKIQYSLNQCIVSAQLYNAEHIKMEISLNVSYAKQKDIKYVNQTFIESNKNQKLFLKVKMYSSVHTKES